MGSKGTCHFYSLEYEKMSTFLKELEITVDFKKQFGISFNGALEKHLLE